MFNKKSTKLSFEELLANYYLIRANQNQFYLNIINLENYHYNEYLFNDNSVLIGTDDLPFNYHNAKFSINDKSFDEMNLDNSLLLFNEFQVHLFASLFKEPQKILKQSILASLVLHKDDLNQGVVLDNQILSE